MAMESGARADSSFGVSGARTGGEPSGAHRDRRAEPVACGGIQILGMVLDGPDVSEDDRDSTVFAPSTRWSMSSSSRLCWFHRSRLMEAIEIPRFADRGENH